MTDTCPPDGELERLLASGMGTAEEQVLVAHLTGCPVCQRRLEELNRGGVTLPPWPAHPEPGRENVPRHAGTPEQTANFLPSLAPPTAQQGAPERKLEATGHPTPAPSSVGATTPPSGQRETASPNAARGLEKPVTVPPQRDRNTTPQLAADPQPISGRPDATPAPPAFFGRYQVRRALGGGWQIRCTNCVEPAIVTQPLAPPPP